MRLDKTSVESVYRHDPNTHPTPRADTKEPVMTTIQFTTHEHGRKHLATVIAQTIDATVVYAGAPSFAYQIGQARLDRDWCLHLPLVTNLVEVIEAAVAAGFHTATGSEAERESVGLTLVFPTTGWTGGGLRGVCGPC